MTCSSVLELKLYSWNPPPPLVSQLHAYAIYAGTGHHINVDKNKDTPQSTTLPMIVGQSSLVIRQKKYSIYASFAINIK